MATKSFTYTESFAARRHPSTSCADDTTVRGKYIGETVWPFPERARVTTAAQVVVSMGFWMFWVCSYLRLAFLEREPERRPLFLAALGARSSTQILLPLTRP